ncbi:hypothetical protein WJX74_002833 [Apatococcus lobatus]|uniref:Uncharacterized protein n=1 Tax=Apatococcus lobatus TaxID=904363 RepID=A0AAW1RLL2_9CHLO
MFLRASQAPLLLYASWDSKASRPPVAAMVVWASQNLVFMENVRSLAAAARGCTPGQLALALVHVQLEDVFSISGTSCIKYLKENVAAAHLKLTADEKKRLETNFDARHVARDWNFSAMTSFTHAGGKA